MRRYLGVALLLLLCTSAFGRTRVQGNCEQGGNVATVSGINSTQKFQRSFPGCTVSVFQTGTVTLVSGLYSDNSGTPLSNPFTASSSDGHWFFYVDDGVYDVQLSGAGITSPFTLGAIPAAGYVTTITSFSGAIGAQIDAACASFSTTAGRGLVVIPASSPVGWTSNGVPDGCIIDDLRGTGNSTGTGNFLSGRELYSRNTASAAAATVVRGPLTLESDDYAGGVNLLTNKTQSQLVSGTYTGRDLGEHHGAGNFTTECQGAGDCLAYMNFIKDWGGYNVGGDEGQEFRLWDNVGNGTASGAVPTSASVTVSGNTISGTWTNAHSLGVRNAPLIITSRGTYSTGTITAATFSGGICHITGSGTLWNALSNIVAMRIPQFELGSAKFVVPVSSINSNTDISLNWNQNELGATCAPSTFVAGTYVLYQGSTVTSLGGPAVSIDPNSVVVASGAPFLNGDAVEQPIDYNVTMHGIVETLYSPFNAGGLHVGNIIQNLGPGIMESGVRIMGSNGTIQNGVRTTGTVNTIIKVDSTAASGGANVIQSSATNAVTDNLFAFLNGASASRNLEQYDRPNDQLNLGNGLHASAADTRISTNSNVQSSVEFWLGYNNAGWNGLSISPVVDPSSDSVFPLSSNSAAGIPNFGVAKTRVIVNNGFDLKGYSDNQTTQQWGITGAGGAASFKSVAINGGTPITGQIGTGGTAVMSGNPALPITGVSNNSSAAAGIVGEYVVGQQLTPVSLTTATVANITSITLTSGDWDVYGTVQFTGTSTTAIGLHTGVSTVNNSYNSTAPDFSGMGLNQITGTQLGSILIFGPVRYAIVGPITYYLNADAVFSSGTNLAAGTIRARRVR